MEQMQKMLTLFRESGLINVKKYHSVEVGIARHENWIVGQPEREDEMEYSVYGFNVAAGQNILGTGSSFENAIIDYKAQANRLA